MPVIARLRRRLLAGLLVLGLGVVGPVAPATAAPVAHWIGIRTAADGRHQEFYDTRTGARFVPRGVNLLKDELVASGPYPILDLIVAPGEYDQVWLDDQLTHIARLGYNTIRVWLDHCPGTCLTDPGPVPKPAWLDNVAALLSQAKAHGLVVILVSNELPEAYVGQLPCCDPFHAGFNGQILTDAGLDTARTYWRQILGGLLERGAPLEVVLAYELQDESFFDTNLPPLSLAAGVVTTANGQSYDMADPVQKLDMLDDGAVFWADRLREAIRAIDPGALVTVGFFAPDEPHSVRPGDTRLVRTERFLRESTVDFLDLHAYPDLDLYLLQIVANFTLDASITKPVLMGEYGSILPAHPDGAAAGASMVGWQALSCTFGFDGWLLWVWGSLEPSVLHLEADGEAMATAPSPLAVPDVCNPPPQPVNLAFQRPVAVTSELPGAEGFYAVDGLVLSLWNSGGPPPAEIVIDLGTPKTISEIRLLTLQDPAGTTMHRVEVRRPVGGWMLLEKLTGFTAGDQWLRVFPSAPVTGIRWIRVKTQKSPSWVGWRDIQVLSPP